MKNRVATIMINKTNVRLRFTSNHPKDISDELIDVIAELETLMPYVHLPVQSGNDDILKKMNRNYTADWYREVVLLEQTSVVNQSKTIQELLTELIAQLGEKVIISRFERWEINHN